MWENIVVEEAPEVVATDAQIDAFEAALHVTLPADHGAFLKTYGEGVLFNHVRIFGLEKMQDEAAQFQSRWSEYFLWGGAGSALDEAQIGRCVIIGDTFNGDEFALSPDFPGTVFYLPQDQDIITNLGTSLQAALDTCIDALRAEVAGYDEDEQEEWDLRPVFNRASF